MLPNREGDLVSLRIGGDKFPGHLGYMQIQVGRCPPHGRAGMQFTSKLWGVYELTPNVPVMVLVSGGTESRLIQ